MRKLMMWMAVAVCVVMAGSASAQTHVESKAKTHRVLFALLSGDEMDWTLTVHNVHNLIDSMKPDAVEIEVVAYGPGVQFVTKNSKMAADVKELLELHVKVVACEHAMAFFKLEKKDLVDGVGTVPAGIAEVVKKQEEGWVYIKAGR